MKSRVTLEHLVALVDGDNELVSVLIERGIIELDDDGFTVGSVDRVLTSRTLVRELEVNWEGLEIILRLREQLATARRRLAALDDVEPADPDDD